MITSLEFDDNQSNIIVVMILDDWDLEQLRIPGHCFEWPCSSPVALHIVLTCDQPEMDLPVILPERTSPHTVRQAVSADQDVVYVALTLEHLSWLQGGQHVMLEYHTRGVPLKLGLAHATEEHSAYMLAGYISSVLDRAVLQSKLH